MSKRNLLLGVTALAVFLLAKLRAQHNAKLYVDHVNASSMLRKGIANLKLQDFHVPLVFKSSLAQLGLLVLGTRLRADVQPDLTEQLTLPGGENVFLDWFYPTEEITANMPIVIYLPGITGKTIEAGAFIERVRERGYIAIVFHRRGHVQPLKLPEFNIFGNCGDLKHALESIKKEMPSNPISLVGSSAGSAVMVRYLGEFNTHEHVVCAVGLSPGYDVEHLWGRIERTPLDQYLLAKLKEFFVERNAAMLAEKNKRALEELRQVKSVHEFALVASAFAKHDRDHTFEEWLELTCPLRVSREITVPTLCLNAMDDPICLGAAVERIGYQLPLENKFCALVTTDIGSHCAHQDFSRGRWLPDNWGHTIALDFIDGVLKYHSG